MTKFWFRFDFDAVRCSCRLLIINCINFYLKDSTHAYLEGITLLEMENWISVEAYSKGGETDSRTSFTLFELYASFWGK